MTTLEKIKAEIQHLNLIGYADVCGKREIAEKAVLDIIDKYETKLEPTEECDRDCEHCTYIECPKGGERMTREEINILQNIVDIYEKKDMYPLLKDKEMRTIKLAIKELKQEPCEDAVSRQAVINLVRGCNSALEEPRIFNCHNAGIKFEQYITELPSVQSKGGVK